MILGTCSVCNRLFSAHSTEQLEMCEIIFDDKARARQAQIEQEERLNKIRRKLQKER